MPETSLNIGGSKNTNINLIKSTSSIGSISSAATLIISNRSQGDKINSSTLHLDYSESSEQDNGLDSLTVAASVISSIQRHSKFKLIFL